MHFLVIFLSISFAPLAGSFQLHIPIIGPRLKFSVTTSLADDEPLLLHPAQCSENNHQSPNAVIVVPGCMLKPHQYQGLAESIQSSSEQNTFVYVAKNPMDMANPLSIRFVLEDAIDKLKKAGYNGESVSIVGHSLGGIFLPKAIQDLQLNVSSVIFLGGFRTRQDKSVNMPPSLTICGDLDGLIRTSRIAEDYYNSVMKAGNTEAAKLHHSVVLVEGMNHFQIIQGQRPFMKGMRDLEPEISDQEAVAAVGATIGNFLDHQVSSSAKQGLLQKIMKTEEYLQPLVEAMKLEGNHFISDSHPFSNKGVVDHKSDSEIGSSWIEELQLEMIANTTGRDAVNSISDEFHQSWWFNPFHDPPFYHPKVELSDEAPTKLDVLTVSEAVYEKFAGMFDGGLVSNTALELRAKFNSPQAIHQALGINTEFESSLGVASELNRRTIEWAIANAPESVRRRYESRGRKLVAGQDIACHSGPGWIWSHINFHTNSENGDVVVNSHIMNTPVDHPIPFVGGKLYCKILSPARVLDWMYTDSLRPEGIAQTAVSMKNTAWESARYSLEEGLVFAARAFVERSEVTPRLTWVEQAVLIVLFSFIN